MDLFFVRCCIRCEIRDEKRAREVSHRSVEDFQIFHRVATALPHIRRRWWSGSHKVS